MRRFRLLPRYRRKHRRCAHTFAIISVACGSIVSLRIRGRAPIGHERQHRGRGQQKSPTCHIRFSSGVIDAHKRAPLHKHGRPPTTTRGTDACRAIWQAHPKRPASRVPPLQPISSSPWEPPRVVLSRFNHPWPRAFPHARSQYSGVRNQESGIRSQESG